MRKTIKFSIITLVLIILFSFSVSAYHSNQASSYNRPAYYNQYTYTHNSAYGGMNYVPASASGRVGQPYYVVGQGRTLFGYSSNDCSNFGCRPVQTSNMAIRNQLDFVYYNNPSLLEPRKMDSQSRTVPRNYGNFYW